MKNAIPSCLYSGNVWFVEELYEAYLNKPESIDKEWRGYFDSLQDGTSVKDIPHSPVRQAYVNAAKHRHSGVITVQAPAADAVSHQKQTAVLQLINAHRFNGHRQNLSSCGLSDKVQLPAGASDVNGW